MNICVPKKLLLILCFSLTLAATAQNNHRLQISLLTCAPGTDLYSIFGHTALRVIDSINQTDAVYNYGTFEFEENFSFYLKFARGKLDYYLSVEDGRSFFENYNAEGRTITEQVLALNDAEKEKIITALNTNLQSSNKYYKYDFLYDNCTTRARDVLKANTTYINNNKLVRQGTTFRNMLHRYLDKGNMHWSKLGIDVLLGSKIDKEVTIEQSSFLPDYLQRSVDSCNKKKYLVQQKNTYPASTVADNSINQPAILFGTLLAFFLVLLLLKQKKWLSIYSNFLLFITGLLGIVLLLMWFATNHQACSNNYNLLWALPTNLTIVFIKNKQLQIKYYKVLFAISALLLLFWFMLPQELNINLIPFVATLMLVYYIKFKRLQLP